MNIAPLGREATLDDLWDYEGPAELINGEIVPVTPGAYGHGRAAYRIRRSLDDHARAGGEGHDVSEGVGFILQTPRTQLLIPDAAWWVGPTEDGALIQGAPALAVEVRSPSNYGPAAEREMALKRDLYFAAGTRVVWDVDVLREGVIRVYRADDPQAPTLYHRGEIAEAEPAVPGWRFPVDELFR